MTNKPDQISLAGGLLLASGIFSLLTCLGLLLGTLCLWIPAYYGIGSAIYAIVRGSKLLGSNSYGSGVPKAAAIMQIVQIINFDLFGMGLGIAALVILNSPDIVAWLEGSVPAPAPGQGYGGYAPTPAVTPAQGGWSNPADQAAGQAAAAAAAAAAARPQAPASAPPDLWGNPTASTSTAAASAAAAAAAASTPPADPWGAPPAADPWAPPASDPWGAPAKPAAGGGYSVAPWGSEGDAAEQATAAASAAAAAGAARASRHTVVEQAIDASKPPAESPVSAGGWGGWGDEDPNKK